MVVSSLAKKKASLVTLVLVLLLFSATNGRVTAHSSAQTTVTPVTPIQHIVIIVQENHPFDQFFGVYPGVPSGYGLNLNVCLPAKKGPCVKPWNSDKNPNVQGQDIPHNSEAGHHDYNNGKMNGFVSELPSDIQNYSLAYYTNRTIPT